MTESDNNAFLGELRAAVAALETNVHDIETSRDGNAARRERLYADAARGVPDLRALDGAHEGARSVRIGLADLNLRLAQARARLERAERAARGAMTEAGQ